MKQLDEATSVILDRRYRATAIILFVQIASVFLLTFASFLLAGKVQPFGAATGEVSFSLENLTNPNANGGALTTFLWVTILAVAVSSFLLRRVIYSSETLRDTATLKGAAGLLQSVQTKTILLTALGELAAILGFIISLASGNWLDMARAAVIAVIVIFINFPRKSSWAKLAQAASR